MIEKNPPGWFISRDCARSPTPSRLTYDGQYPQDGLCAVVGAPGSGKTTMLIANLHRWGVERHKARPGGGPFRAVYIALEGFWGALECAESHRQNIGILPGGETPQVTVLAPGEFKLLDTAWLTAWLAEVDAGKSDVSWGFEEGGDEAASIQAHEDARAAIARPDVVVIDSLSRAITGHDENSNAVMSQVVAAAERVQHAFGAGAIFLVHHPAGSGTLPRGGSALWGALDGAVFIRRRGDAVTVTNTKARDYPDGVVRRFVRSAVALDTLAYPDALRRMEFEEVQGTVPKKKDPPGNQGVVPEPPATTEPKAAPPAAGLRGLPLECWKALALGAGQSMPEAAAAGTLKAHPCLGGVEARRRMARITDVLKSWQARGLLVGGVVTNPA